MPAVVVVAITDLAIASRGSFNTVSCFSNHAASLTAAKDDDQRCQSSTLWHVPAGPLVLVVWAQPPLHPTQWLAGLSSRVDCGARMLHAPMMTSLAKAPCSFPQVSAVGVFATHCLPLIALHPLPHASPFVEHGGRAVSSGHELQQICRYVLHAHCGGPPQMTLLCHCWLCNTGCPSCQHPLWA